MKHQSGHTTGGHTTLAAEQGAKDPVCGMNVDPKLSISPIRHEHEGKTYYFCSAQCLSRFQAEPGKYAAQPRGCCS